MIVTANEFFLRTMGYSLQDVVGKHHRMFVTEVYAASQEYRTYWEQLKQGVPVRGEFPRRDRSGNQVGFKRPFIPSWNGMVSFNLSLSTRAILQPTSSLSIP